MCIAIAKLIYTGVPDMNDSVFNAQQREKLEDYTALIGVGIEFVFQPVIKSGTNDLIGYEALLRGHDGESAQTVINGVKKENLAFFDQACRSRAIKEASKYKLPGKLFLNCTHTSFESLELALFMTADQAREHGIERDQIVLEFSELAALGNPQQLALARKRAQSCGFEVCADRYGVGDVGLTRLAVFRPDFLKLDQALIRDIHKKTLRQSVLQGINATARTLGIEVIATGVETEQEAEWLSEKAHIKTFQGFLFGHPQPGSELTEDQSQVA